MRITLGGRSLLVAVLGLGLVVAGCGSSSSSSSTKSTAAAPALTKAEYVKQGNAICKANQAGKQAAVSAYAKAHRLNINGTPTKAEATQLAIAVLIPRSQSVVSALKALVPPSSDQAHVTAMLATTQQGLDQIKRDPAKLVISGPANTFAHAAKLLHAYGLTYCIRNTG